MNVAYRERRDDFRRRTGSNYMSGYPWSAVYVAIPLGILGVLSFHNVFAGAAGFVAATLLGLWYWKPGGRGRRRIEKMEGPGDGRVAVDRSGLTGARLSEWRCG